MNTVKKRKKNRNRKARVELYRELEAILSNPDIYKPGFIIRVEKEAKEAHEKWRRWFL